MDRCWSIATKPGTNDVALGFDEGTIIIKMGREAPAVDMDSTGKILYANNHSDIFSAQLRGGEDGQVGQDGELLVRHN